MVDVRTISMGASAFSQHYRIRHAESGDIWCEAEQVFVSWNVAQKRKQPISPEFRLRTVINKPVLPYMLEYSL